jgi:hypothetical protein
MAVTSTLSSFSAAVTVHRTDLTDHQLKDILLLPPVMNLKSALCSLQTADIALMASLETLTSQISPAC